MISYHWDFGDGGSSTEPNPSHTYGYPGWYSVTLTVGDVDDGRYSIVTKLRNVYVFMEETIPRKTNRCFCLGVRNAIAQSTTGQSA